MRYPMSEWLVPAMVVFFLFGLWGFFPKLSTLYIHPKSALVYKVLGGLFIGVLIYPLPILDLSFILKARLMRYWPA